jgi:outer membrane protein TolC
MRTPAIPSSASGRTAVAAAILLLVSASMGRAQPAGARLAPQDALVATVQGGIPSGAPTSEELALTLRDAIARGLQSNLGSILGRSAVESARGARREVMADLLPQVRLSMSEVRQKINLAAYGFTGPGVPELVGPFDVFDARAHLQQSILDLRALHRLHAAGQAVEAAKQDELGVRDLVVAACGLLYLQALSGESRIAATRAQLDTAQTLLSLARDRRESGLGAGIDVLRADVQAQSMRQRLIVAEQEAAKQKLALARAIGLPLGQRFRLADPMPDAAGLPMSAEAALARAWQQRPDLKAGLARVAAAEEAWKAARGEGLPSIVAGGDYGAIGNTPSGALGTFSIGAALRVPVFEGGRVAARAREAEVRLNDERARLEDLRGRVYYEIQAVFLDLAAAEERVKVAQSALVLARQQLEQSRDRFAAGVADSVEVVQTQEALAAAEENRIASLYAQDAALFSLARALGGAETGYETLVKGH